MPSFQGFLGWLPAVGLEAPASCRQGPLGCGILEGDLRLTDKHVALTGTVPKPHRMADPGLAGWTWCRTDRVSGQEILFGSYRLALGQRGEETRGAMYRRGDGRKTLLTAQTPAAEFFFSL